VPFGFFQENWDQGEERGYTKYKWDVYDTMQQCTVGMDEATDDDPLAQAYCRQECPLTEVATDRDAEGQYRWRILQGLRWPRPGQPRSSAAGRRDEGEADQRGDRRLGSRVRMPAADDQRHGLRPGQGPGGGRPPIESLARPSGRIRRALGVDWGTHAVAVLAERHGSYVAIREGRVFDGRWGAADSTS
jgi:hypothetical protein